MGLRRVKPRADQHGFFTEGNGGNGGRPPNFNIQAPEKIQGPNTRLGFWSLELFW
jgi:hypothetical protein